MLNPANFLSPDLPTVQDVRNLIQMASDSQSGSAMITARTLLLDRDLNPVPVPVPSSDIENDISDYVQSSTVSWKATEDVQRTATVIFGQLPGLTMGLSHRIQINCCFLDPVTGRVLLEVPKGIFRGYWPDRDIDSALTVLTLNATDLTMALVKDYIDPYAPPVGYPVVDALVNLAASDYRSPSMGGRTASSGAYPWGNDPGLTPAGCDHAGPNWQRTRIDAVPSTTGWPVRAPYTYKDNIMATFKEQLTALNYYPAWANSYGRLQLQPTPFQYVDADNIVLLPSPEWMYTSDEHDPVYGNIFQGKLQQRLGDPKKMANIVQFVSMNNASAPIYVRLENHNANSAISLENWGDSQVLTIQDDNVTDLATAQLRCFLELQRASSTYSTLVLPLGINPFHEAYDFVGVDIESPDGLTVINGEGQLFQVVAWDMDFIRRTMTLTVQQIVPL